RGERALRVLPVQLHFGFAVRASRRPFAEPDPLTLEEVPCAHDRRLLRPSQPDRTGWLAPGLSLAPQVDGGLGPDSLTLSNVVTPGGARFTQWESIALTDGSQMTLDSNLVLGDAGTLTGSLSIDATSTLFAGGGVNRAIQPFAAGQLATVTNAGLIDVTNGASGPTDRLTITGNYIGQGGRPALNTFPGPDASPSDRLIIDRGAARGTTGIRILNAGGPGDHTIGNGILVSTPSTAAPPCPARARRGRTSIRCSAPASMPATRRPGSCGPNSTASSIPPRPSVASPAPFPTSARRSRSLCGDPHPGPALRPHAARYPARARRRRAASARPRRRPGLTFQQRNLGPGHSQQR